MHTHIRELAYCGCCTALLAVCSWISIPFPIPFTLQTFAVFLLGRLLGGRNATLCVCCYLLCGAIGLPVFSGFRGGISVMFDLTGGYLLGFLLSTLPDRSSMINGRADTAAVSASSAFCPSSSVDTDVATLTWMLSVYSP